jgi:Mg-chelatase subunit ChlD
MICAAALVLLLDASGSVGAHDWALQVAGHASAVEADSVVRVVERDPVAMVALAFSDVTLPLTAWHLIASREDAAAFALALRTSRRVLSGGTDIGGALMDAMAALPNAPCDPEDRVIDLVTDGDAPAEPARRARDEAAAQGIRINALGVGNDRATAWLREHAITPGGFAMDASGWDDFAHAVRRKITMELAAR